MIYKIISKKMDKNIKNEMKIEFLSKSANEAFARISVAAFASQLDPTIEEIADIKTSVSEAVTNSIIHAYPNRDGIVKVKASLLEDEIEIEVSDTGEGIENIDEARKPLFTTKGNLERSGMGFTIMENFMDKLKVESIVGLGTKITMNKKIKRNLDSQNTYQEGKMQEREKTLIAQAQQGDKEILAQIMENNKRTYMEYCKKIFRKRL